MRAAIARNGLASRAWLRDVVATAPAPRPVGTLEAARHLPVSAFALVLAFATMAAAIGIWVRTLDGGPLLFSIAFQVVGLGLSGYLVWGLIRGFWAFRLAARKGLMAHAEVIDVHIEPRVERGKPWEHLEAAGKRRVHHPDGPFDEDFSIATPRVRELRAGDMIPVVVHPTRRLVLAELDA